MANKYGIDEEDIGGGSQALSGRGAVLGGVSGAAAGAPLGPWGAVIGGGLGAAAGGLFGDDSETTPSEEAYADLSGAVITDPSYLTPNYDYEYVTPDMLLGDSQRGWAYADQEAVNAQYDALDQLEKWGQGGLTDADMNNMRLAQMDNARAERGAREATMQQMQSRGMGGSGAELAGILGGQQGMANANNAAGLSMQIAAQDRALRAIEGAGNLSSGIRQSSFDEAYGRGSAIDEFNRANTGYQQDVQGRNTERYNAGQDAAVNANETMYQQQADLAGIQSNVNPGRSGLDSILGAASGASNIVNALSNYSRSQDKKEEDK